MTNICTAVKVTLGLKTLEFTFQRGKEEMREDIKLNELQTCRFQFYYGPYCRNETIWAHNFKKRTF